MLYLIVYLIGLIASCFLITDPHIECENFKKLVILFWPLSLLAVLAVYIGVKFNNIIDWVKVKCL